jgi:hypothetical protein
VQAREDVSVDDSLAHYVQYGELALTVQDTLQERIGGEHPCLLVQTIARSLNPERREQIYKINMHKGSNKVGKWKSCH